MTPDLTPDLTLPQAHREACLMLTGVCLWRAMVDPANPEVAPVRVSRPMFDHLVDHCGLAPGIVIGRGGEELPAFTVFDEPRAMAAVGAVPWPRSGLILPPGRA